MVKNLPAKAEDIRDMGSIPGVGKIPWRRAWQRTLVFWPGEHHGQRSLMVYSPQGHEESDVTNATEHAQCICRALRSEAEDLGQGREGGYFAICTAGNDL